MPQRDDATLLDVCAAANLAIEFRGDVDFEGFQADRKTQSAVLHQLLVMGEAVKRLSESFRRRFPEVPWSLLAKMRDRLIHGYDSIDLAVVWQTIHDDIPQLIPVLMAIATGTDPDNLHQAQP
jgi:uncharacterized protein with HEPN domain